MVGEDDEEKMAIIGLQSFGFAEIGLLILVSLK
jgi:hypothetical protein